jgi:arylsulfatase A-like enzyme
LALLGCRGQVLAPDHIDLVVSGELIGPAGPVVGTQCLCADETWTAVGLDDGDVLAAGVDLEHRPVLTLAGCIEGDASIARDARLSCDVRDDHGAEVETTVPLVSDESWWEHRIDLGRLSRRSVRVRIEVSGLGTNRLWLRRIDVGQEVPLGRRERRPLQVLLISVDTLRHDAVRSGGGSVVVPQLERLGGEAEVFSRHYAASHWTKPSHASMLTGFSPLVHRALDATSPIEPALTTVAERFRQGGFATAAMVYDCGWLKPEFGFARGFDEYHVSRWRTDRMVRAAVNWIRVHRERPFFAFLHTFEVHSDARIVPYEAPGVSRTTIATEFALADACCRSGRCADRLLTAMTTGEEAVRPGDAELYHELYRRSVRFVDQQLGALCAALRAMEVWDNLLLVVTSDHGEEFWEHHGFGHRTVYDEVLRVPLLIKWPGGERAGYRNNVPSVSTDLAPTLLAAAALDTSDLPGRHLNDRRDGDPLFAGTESVVVQGHWKAIAGGQDEQARVFDLEHDPGELHDLGETRVEIRDRLAMMSAEQRRRMEALHAQLTAGKQRASPVHLSGAERERLEALGYLR